MKKNKTALLVWLICALVCGSVPVTIGISYIHRSAYQDTAAFINNIAGIFLSVVFAIPAALIISRQPRNTIGWLLMLPALSIAFGSPIEIYLKVATDLPPTPFILFISWFSGWSWILVLFPFINIPLLFPNGKPLSPRWRWVSILTVIWAGLFFLGGSVIETIGDINDNSFQNPIGLIPNHVFESLLRIWLPVLFLLTLLSVIALILRYRTSNKLERVQINWLLYSCLVFFLVYLLIGVFNLGGSQTFLGYIAGVLLNLSLMLVPISIAIAILRYRLWDIDVIIRRTLVYTILTAFLALVYLGSVSILQTIFSAITGEKSTAAIVISTLSIAALFNPLHKRVRSLIDQRFYRQKYDAEKALASFSNILRDPLDLDDLSMHISSVVQKTIQPSHVSVILVCKSIPSPSDNENRFTS